MQAVVRSLRSNRDAEGMATVVACFCAMALIATMGLVLHVGAATLARHHAETAADLGALAGAAVVLDGRDEACSAAASVVAANGGIMQDCSTDGADVVVDVSVAARLGPVMRSATGRARAGPVAEQSP